MEAFSDGVLAIIITIMVLEMKVPQHAAALNDLAPLWPVFLSYVLSFVYLGIYWNNHHHMLHAAQRVNGTALWANMHLLFWLSLVPFVTGWMGENHFAPMPTALYGAVLFMAAVAFLILERCLIALHGRESVLARAVGSDWKANASVVLYLVGIGVAFLVPWVSWIIYALVALMWFIPDRRIERELIPGEPPKL